LEVIELLLVAVPTTLEDSGGLRLECEVPMSGVAVRAQGGLVGIYGMQSDDVLMAGLAELRSGLGILSLGRTFEIWMIVVVALMAGNTRKDAAMGRIPVGVGIYAEVENGAIGKDVLRFVLIQVLVAIQALLVQFLDFLGE
jgi:hypothetical protein